MRDLISEIWESVRRNKLRTCLTGFAVAWGIFMLIVLLGAGKGLMNAFTTNANGIATNSIQIFGGYTTKAYAGYKANRQFSLNYKDVDITKSKLFSDYIDDVSPVVSVQSAIIVNGKHSASGTIEGNYPERLRIEKRSLLAGRFINDNDIKHSRKVIVIPSNVAEILVDNPECYAELIGKSLKINGVSFMVIGICKEDAMSNTNTFIAPYSTVCTIWAKGQTIDNISFTFHGIDSEAASKAFEKEYKKAININHKADPEDESAVWIWNRFAQHLQMEKGGSLIDTALWIVGLFTLLSGIVGVSNIMLITVKERKREFGVRKAIGAKPWNITKLIISESIAITSFFGYIGMVLGLIACKVLDITVGRNAISVMGEEMTILKNVSVGVDTAIGATIVLIIAGTLAGMIPARKAAKVRPIEALRA